jgi:hypothetical protein
MKQEFGKPRYTLAYDLLRAYRTLCPYRQCKRGEYAKGKSKAIDRIKKLKRSHPLCTDALVPILLQLQLNRDGITAYRASGRGYLGRKRATGPFFMVNRYLESLGFDHR